VTPFPIEDRALRIVDFSTHMSGPLASHLLAEMGAEVIKVEPPVVGDGNRGDKLRINGEGLFHVALNSGVRSIAVSTRSEAWPSIVDACSRWADAVIVGSRPESARKRGLDFASLQRSNVDLVYCLISGFGTDGPWARYSAHGQTIDALAGLAPVEWRDGVPVTPAGWRSTGGTLAGVFGAMGVLSGVLRRDRTGTAQHVTVSLWGSAMWWSWRDLTSLANLGEPWGDYAELGPRYAMYATADRRSILVAPIELKFWLEFCDLLGLPESWRDRGDWSSGSEFGVGPAHSEEATVIAGVIKTKTLNEWWELFGATNIPFAPLLTVAEALESDHAAAQRVMRATTTGGTAARVPAIPVRVGGSNSPDAGDVPALPPLKGPPKLGEHTAEILAVLGLPKDLELQEPNL
jgi:crotonobetainyl-CoA:carnitine CoA-transferase CaiB-like acyl-CoA transferase